MRLTPYRGSRIRAHTRAVVCRRRTTAVVGGLFALVMAVVSVVAGLSGPVAATAVSAAGSTSGPVPASPPDLAGTVVAERSIAVGGVARTYRSIAPPVASAHALPLLVVLHGRGQQAWTAVRATGFVPLARRGQAVLVYPDGLARSWNAGSGCCGVAGIRGTPDTAFVAAVVATALRELPVDPARVYLVGYSNGGKLAWSLACGDPAAFAAVATYGAVPLAPCPTAKPLPSFLAVGVHDRVLPMGGDASVRPALPSARVASEWLAARDQCTAPPVMATEGGAMLERWTTCRAGTEVDLAVYPGADHSWPTAVTGEMWTFLDAHRSPCPGGQAPARTPAPT